VAAAAPGVNFVKTPKNVFRQFLSKYNELNLVKKFCTKILSLMDNIIGSDDTKSFCWLPRGHGLVVSSPPAE
jgi:hypothetical protein